MRNNAKWLIICRFFQSLLQMAAGMLVARYLSAVAYGHLNYAASVAAFAIPVAQLGLNSTLIQELGERPQREGEILGTALLLQLLSGFLCLPAVVLFSLAAKPGDWETAAVCALYGTGLIFQAGELMQFPFHARGNIKLAALAALAAGIASSGYKLGLMAAGKGVLWFALGHSVEYCVLGLLLLACYRGGGLRFSKAMAVRLLRKSRHYIAAGMMLVVLHNTDHVMVTLMAGAAENGYYSAAMTCAGAAGFLYNGILDAARPAILAASRRSEAEMETALVRLYRLVLGMALVQSGAVCLLAQPLVIFLYGVDYKMAVPVLRILVWYLLFAYMGSVRNLWILAAGKHSCLWVINGSMAALNIALNAGMIPHWGARGAAAASVLTQFFGNFLLGWLWKPLRKNHILLLRSVGRKQ